MASDVKEGLQKKLQHILTSVFGYFLGADMVFSRCLLFFILLTFSSLGVFLFSTEGGSIQCTNRYRLMFGAAPGLGWRSWSDVVNTSMCSKGTQTHTRTERERGGGDNLLLDAVVLPDHSSSVFHF